MNCQNLTLTLYKGGIELAMEEFPATANDGNDDSVTWNIDVDRNMTRFNRSGGRTSIEFSIQNLELMHLLLLAKYSM